MVVVVMAVPVAAPAACSASATSRRVVVHDAESCEE